MRRCVCDEGLNPPYGLNDAILTLRGRAAWAHDYNSDRNIAATFQTLLGASIAVNGAARRMTSR